MGKVMIVENDFVMADMFRLILIMAGYEVVGIARTVEESLELHGRSKPDLALVDVRLAGGRLGTEIAARVDLTTLGILYVTGNTGEIKLTCFNGVASLVKPCGAEELVRSLQLVTEMVGTGKVTPPFPSGFRLLVPGPGEVAEEPDLPGENHAMHVPRLLRQQAALATFGTFALGETNLGKILTEAARVCAESFGVPFCKICRYRFEENDLLIEAGVGWRPGVVGRVVSKADETSPQGRAFVTGKAIICEDLRKDTSFVAPAFYAEHGIRSTMDVIIKKRAGQPWGVLEIDNPEPHAYGEHDINFATGFANVLAEAVNSARRNNMAQATLSQMRDMVADKDRLVVSQARLLAEKGTLAQELQHRVRNNLQLVYGMLNMQIQFPEVGTGQKGISAIARRVLALAKVYDHLLGAGLTRTIDFGGYLSSLCESFGSVESTNHRDIELSCNSAPLMLDLDKATALGLAVTELISNSYRHAFPEGIGKITISAFLESSGTSATIEFADDGIGFNAGAANERRGLGLVQRLMEQVYGSAEVRSKDGVTWILRFPVSALDDVFADDVESPPVIESMARA